MLSKRQQREELLSTLISTLTSLFEDKLYENMHQQVARIRSRRVLIIYKIRKDNLFLRVFEQGPLAMYILGRKLHVLI
jgi:hypothetical protein